MGENQFWHLAHPNSTARCAEWIHSEMRTEQVICPINEGHRRGGKRLTDLSIAMRRLSAKDFVWTWHSECLIQEHVLDLLQRNSFTGFDVKPVKASFMRSSKLSLPKLWELVVIGWSGMALTESGITLVEHCQACHHLRYSPCTNVEHLIDHSQWDGSDFFMVWPLPKFIFITDRVANVIRENRLKGAVLRRVSEIKFSQDYGFSPGRLSYWMPEERARQLGGALGID